jgi:sugar fermentation stimulation protein A
VEFPADLITARFVVRQNRFVVIADCGGTHVRAHLPNTGRLSEILVPGRPVYLSPADGPHRKTSYTLLLAELDGRLICLDSASANTVAFELLCSGDFPLISSYSEIRREVTRGGSRYDLVLSGKNLPDFIVEVKGVNLVRDGHAMFPDAPTERGRRHIAGLTRARAGGERAAIVFIIMRNDAVSFSPNDMTDPAFGVVLREAADVGVEVYAFTCRVDMMGMRIDRQVPVILRE